MRSASEYLRAAVWVLAALVGALVAHGQGTLVSDPNLPVQVGLDQFGAGDEARAGEWAGVRVKLRDSASTSREVLVRLHGLDSDGDVPVSTRDLTLNPGVDQFVWMYVRLPFNFKGGDELSLTVYEAREGGRKPTGEPWFSPGDLLGRATFTPAGPRVNDPQMGLMAVIGPRTLGLSGYSERPAVGTLSDAYHLRLHENVKAVPGLLPASLPDSWLGLTQFEAIVWAGGEPLDQHEPNKLDPKQAEAIRDYVSRGGHLVIILPAVGQVWTNRESNRLKDLMPTVSVQRNENVDPAPYRPLLNIRPTLRYPTKGQTVHTFRVPADAEPQDAMEILNGPDGRCVVVRRLFGAGAVTLVGLDLNDTAFSQGGALDAEVFWHRVLGWRGKLTPDDANNAGPNAASIFGTSRTPYYMDGDIQSEIAQTGKTAVGVIAGFFVFLAYWLVAGPVGYTVLKSRGMQRHAWVGFVGATIVFTALAWGGAAGLRPQRLEARHFTLLDHVYGQPVQRARMWASVFLPGYGERRLSLGGSPGLGPNAISAWDTPGDDESWAKFPDAREYAIDNADPGTLLVPTRATSKHIQADWAGGPAWKMPIPVAGADGRPGAITLNPDAWPVGTSPVLSGVLTHDLPGPLHDVMIVVFRRQDTLRPHGGDSVNAALDQPIVRATAFRVTSDWAPGSANSLDLGIVTGRPAGLAEGGAGTVDLSQVLGDFIPRPPAAYTIAAPIPTDRSSRVNRLTGLALLHLLPPPNLQDNTVSQYAALRRTTHGWDLSRWATQPSVMVIGHLGGDGADAPSPVPLTVDGETVPTRGRTVVRWVYPLGTNPPSFPAADPGR